MASTGENTPDNIHVSAQLRGETIAYAVQNGIYGLAANLFEPYIGYQTQKYYSKHDAAHPKFGNYTQNLLGEFAGDITGAGTLIVAEALFPTPLHSFMRSARSWVDPLYTTAAHVVFAREKSDPDYDKNVDQWKTFQERNLVRSLIMATGGITGNLATQKLLIGNPSPTSVIFKGKLLSTAVTTALGLAIRLAFPTPMRKLDKWMGATVFTPMLDDVGTPAPHAPGGQSHAEKIEAATPPCPFSIH